MRLLALLLLLALGLADLLPVEDGAGCFAVKTELLSRRACNDRDHFKKIDNHHTLNWRSCALSRLRGVASDSAAASSVMYLIALTARWMLPGALRRPPGEHDHSKCKCNGGQVDSLSSHCSCESGGAVSRACASLRKRRARANKSRRTLISRQACSRLRATAETQARAVRI